MPSQDEQDYFDELKEWSERKLNLIKEYLASATKILGSINKVYYVDGFAGRGTYGKSGEPQTPGSPVQAAELAYQYEQDAKSYVFECINVEEKLEYFEGLEVATQPYRHLVTNIYGVFSQHVDHILNKVGSNPVVCFLDPFGVEGLDWVALQKMIRRPGKTDFWIRFDTDAVRRREGWYKNLPDQYAISQYQVLLRTYGFTDADQLHNKLNVGLTPEERKLTALHLYMDRLRDEIKKVSRKGYVESYRIGSLQEGTKYHLIFASSNKKGFTLASNIVYKIEEDYQMDIERYNESIQPSMFGVFGMRPSPEEIKEVKVKSLKEDIWTICKGQTLTRGDIHAKVLENGPWFGIVKGPHFTEALKALIQDGRIKGDPRPVSDDKTIFNFNS